MIQYKRRFSSALLYLVIGSVATLILAGCGGSSGSGTGSRQGAQNQLPRISGTPSTLISVGTSFSFQPSASDPDGDHLTFSIENQPAWTNFDSATGRLTGTPMPADVGTYAHIAIRVSDGLDAVVLPDFSIGVTQIGTGSATISWLPPVQNTDGTALTDLAGFRIYFGNNASSLDQTVTISTPSLTSYMIENLPPGTWSFIVRAFAADGAESPPSNIASKTIQ